MGKKVYLDKTNVRDNTRVVLPIQNALIPKFKPTIENKTENISKSAQNYLDVFDRVGGKDIFKRLSNARVNIANKYFIPYIPEKRIRLTTGRYNTGVISTNILDSIYNSAQRTGVPFDIALGLAGRESTLGIGRGLHKNKGVSGTDLYSNWQQTGYVHSQKKTDEYNDIVKKIRNDYKTVTDEEYDKAANYLNYIDNSLNNLKELDENPIDNALKFYQSGKYNPGDKRHTQMVEEDAKIIMSDPAIQKWYQNKINSQMKCGGRRKAQLGLDIREGGIAIPIAPNMYYMDGRSHDNGGIAIGPNNKNGLEVEGGEVVKVGKNDVKVFSSVPLLRGVSPAQLVMGGVNPNKVFKAQEEFKDRNRINDDGTRYEMGGNRIYTPSKAIQKQLQETGKVTIGGAPTIGGLKNYKYLRALTNIRKYGDIGTNIFRAGKEVIKRGTQKLVDSGKISKEIAQVPRSIYAQFVGGYGQNLPKTFNLFTDDEMKFGGSMIYTINGNVKNGLMSARAKAQYGKEKKINANTKIGEDGLIYTKAIDGDWYTDGTRYEDSKYYMGRKSAQAYSREKFKRQPKLQSLDEVIVTGIRPKAKEESKPITTSSNNGNTITTQTIEGKQVDYPKTKTGYKPFIYKKDKDGKLVKVYDDDKRYNNSYIRPNREGANYKSNKYNPLTGEIVDEQGIVETSEPSIIGTAKVSSSTSSTPRGRGTKSSKPATSTKPANVEAKQPKLVERPKENLYITGIKNNAVKSPIMIGMEKISANPASSPTGGGTQPKDGNWVPQYNLITGRDLLGVGTNLAGHIASYFANRDILDKYPMPTKPVMTPAVKLKTKVNINPDLTNIKESELMGIEATNRNTSSSNTTLARNQRIMNESRDARNKLYAYKENAETQLINQDKLNRQGVYARNIAAYNDWLNKTYVAKTNKLLGKQQILMNLINGIPMAVNNVLGNIETRKSTNDMIQAIAAANPNGDGRLLGIGDYYTQKLANGKIAKYNKNHKFIKYV